MNVLTGPQCIKLYGTPKQCEKNFLQIWDVPVELEVGVIPKRLFCNVDIIVPLNIAFNNLNKAGINSQLKTFDGCYNFRPIRGYEAKYESAMEKGLYDTASNWLSIHSWGIAIDVDASWNRLGSKPTLTPEFVKCFKSAGFDWGGDWKRLDGMHFQLSIDYLKSLRKSF